MTTLCILSVLAYAGAQLFVAFCLLAITYIVVKNVHNNANTHRKCFACERVASFLHFNGKPCCIDHAGAIYSVINNEWSRSEFAAVQEKRRKKYENSK